jgi:hypothetical protein
MLNFVDLRKGEVRRIYLLGTSLIKGEKQAAWCTASALLPFCSGTRLARRYVRGRWTSLAKTSAKRYPLDPATPTTYNKYTSSLRLHVDQRVSFLLSFGEATECQDLPRQRTRTGGVPATEERSATSPIGWSIRCRDKAPAELGGFVISAWQVCPRQVCH